MKSISLLLSLLLWFTQTAEVNAYPFLSLRRAVEQLSSFRNHEFLLGTDLTSNRETIADLSKFLRLEQKAELANLLSKIQRSERFRSFSNLIFKKLKTDLSQVSIDELRAGLALLYLKRIHPIQLASSPEIGLKKMDDILIHKSKERDSLDLFLEKMTRDAEVRGIQLFSDFNTRDQWEKRPLAHRLSVLSAVIQLDSHSDVFHPIGDQRSFVVNMDLSPKTVGDFYSLLESLTHSELSSDKSRFLHRFTFTRNRFTSFSSEDASILESLVTRYGQTTLGGLIEVLEKKDRRFPARLYLNQLILMALQIELDSLRITAMRKMIQLKATQSIEPSLREKY